MSIDNVTFWYHSRMLGSTPSIYLDTGTPGWYTVFRFRAPRFILNICSVAMMSAHPTGQLSISFDSAIFVYSCTPGNMMMFCTLQASTASWYSHLVYSHLCSSMVLINAHALALCESLPVYAYNPFPTGANCNTSLSDFVTYIALSHLVSIVIQ